MCLKGSATSTADLIKRNTQHSVIKWKYELFSQNETTNTWQYVWTTRPELLMRSNFLQEGEESFFEDVQNGGEEKCKCQENEKFISELSSVVLGDEFPPELDGSRHGFKFIIRFLDRPRWGCFVNSKKKKKKTSKTCAEIISPACLH